MARRQTAGSIDVCLCRLYEYKVSKRLALFALENAPWLIIHWLQQRYCLLISSTATAKRRWLSAKERRATAEAIR